MDKKLLVSFMMTAPVAAFGAQSNWTAVSGNLSYTIDASTDNWTPQGLVGNDFKADGGMVVCPVSGGFMTHNAVLAPGQYVFSCAGSQNAVISINGNYLVKKNAQGQPVDADGKVTSDVSKMIPDTSDFTVKYDAETTLAIKVQPISKDANFGVGELKYALNFNFADVKTNLQADFDAITFETVASDDNRAQAQALRNRLAALQRTAAGIQGNINAIDLNNGGSLWAAYTQNALYNWNADSSKAGDAISVSIRSLAADANAYNKDVVTENTIWNNIQTNTAALADRMKEVNDLNIQLNEKRNEIIDAAPAENADMRAYCEWVTKADIDAAQAAIDNYKAAIETAYADLEKTVTFPSKKQEISDEISAISYTTAMADWTAYKAFLDALPGVQNVYGTTFALINDIKISGYGKANVYEDVIGQANIKIAEIYNNNEGYKINAEGGLTYNNPNIAGAAASINKVLNDPDSQIATRKAEIEAVYTELKALVDAQEAQLKAGKKEIKDLTDEYDALNAITNNDCFKDLNKEDQQTVIDDLQKIKDAIDALQAEMEKEYLAHELDVDGAGFTAKKDAVSTAFTQYDNDTQDFSGVLGLMFDLEKQKIYVKNATSNSKISKYNLNDKFSATFDNIQAAIDAFYHSNAGSAADIQAAIDAVQTSCDALVGAYLNAENKIAEAQKALNNFNTVIKNKEVVTINGVKAYDKDAYTYPSTVQTALDKYVQDLKDIAAGEMNPQDSYNAAVKVSEKITTDNYAQDIVTKQNAWVKTVTDANLAAVQAVADDIAQKKTVAPYSTAAGMSAVDVTLTLPKGYTGAKNADEAATNVTAAGTNATALAKCDSDLIVLAAAYDAVYVEIRKVVNNYDAYMALLGEVSVAQRTINTYLSDLDKVTVEPALSYFKNTIGGQLQTELNDINAAIATSYNGLTEVADRNGHSGKIAALIEKIGNKAQDAVDNQKYYDAQVLAAKDLANKANALIDWLNANDFVPANLQKYLDDIKGVTDQLAEENVKLTKSFGEGKSKEHDPNYQADFKNLEDQLKAIYDAETEGYKSAVEKANADYLKTQNVVKGGLDQQYLDAVAWVNAYRYDIKNKGYYDALMSNTIFRENHQKLQDCYAATIALEERLANFVTGLTAAPDRSGWIVLTDNNVTIKGDKLQNIVDESNTIQNTIETCLRNIDTAAKGVADTYYGTLEGSASTKYGDIVDRLKKAGFSQDTVDSEGETVPGEVSKALDNEKCHLTEYITSAEKTHNKYVDKIDAAAVGTEAYNNAVHDYVLEMSNICDNLDKVDAVNVDDFVKDAIAAQWKANYEAALKTVNDYIEELKGYTMDPNFSSDLSALNTYKNGINRLNEAWGRLSTSDKEANFDKFDNAVLVNGAVNTHDNLENILSDAATVIANAKAAHVTAVANSEALKVLVTNKDSEYNNAEEAIARLLAWSGYRADQIAEVNALTRTLNNIKGAIESDGALDANKNTYLTDFRNLNSLIENAYPTVFGQEKTFANDLLIKARSAFNNAKKNGVTDEALAPYDEQIKQLTKALTALTYDKDDKDGCMSTLFGIEDKLCALIDELEEMGRTTTVTTDTMQDALDALDEQYKGVKGQLDKLLSDITTEGEQASDATYDYGRKIIDEFAPKVNELINLLNKVNGDYTADGTDVISNADEFAYLMGQYAQQCSDLRNEWQPKQAKAEKQFINDTQYDALVAQLNTLEQAVAMTHEQCFKYGYSFDETWYERIVISINGQDADPDEGILYVQGQRRKLAQQKANCVLTRASKLDLSLVQDAESYVRTTLKRVAKKVAIAEQSYVESAINAIENAGLNENGLKVHFHDAAKIINDLVAESGKIDVVAEGIVTIYELPDPLPSDPDNTVLTTPEQAINNYTGIIDALDAIRTAVDGIVEAAQQEKYIKGDIDTDGDITVLDVQKLITMVGEEVDLEGKDKETADVNEDENVNVADVTALINMMMGNNGNAQMRLRAYLGAVNGNNNIRVEEVAGENGLRRYAVVLTNEVAFAAGQLDIVLPEYAHVAGVALGDRASALETYVFENNGSTRVIMTSLENDLIEGNNGCVLFIDVEGNAEVKVENVIFSDINGNAYGMGNGTTGVDNLYDSIKNGVKAIYNAAGQKLNSLTRGVNIIRNADGSVTKKIGK